MKTKTLIVEMALPMPENYYDLTIEYAESVGLSANEVLQEEAKVILEPLLHNHCEMLRAWKKQQK